MHLCIEQGIDCNHCEVKRKKYIKIIMEDYVPKLLIEHNYWFLRMDGGGNHHFFCSSMS